jgi:hypothetical protein
VKFTEIEQLLPEASVVPQVVVSLNAEEVLLPPMEIKMPVRVALPVLDSVTGCTPAAFGTLAVNVSDDAVRPAMGAGTAVPVPLSVTVCGEPAALSVTVMIELSVATDFGVNAMVKLQLAPGASDVAQVVVSLKSLVSETV